MWIIHMINHHTQFIPWIHEKDYLLLGSQCPEIQKKGRGSSKPTHECHGCCYLKPTAVILRTIIQIIANKDRDTSGSTRGSKSECWSNLPENQNGKILKFNKSLCKHLFSDNIYECFHIYSMTFQLSNKK